MKHNLIKVYKKILNIIAYFKSCDGNFKGKKYCALGDSTTAGFNATTDYCLIVSNKLGMKYINKGISGTSIAKRQGQKNEMCNRYLDIPEDVDIITILGGTNDAGSKVTIGNMQDRTEDTFYGACHLLFGGVKSKYSNKKIGVITPLPRITTTEGIMEKYCRVVKDVAEYYSLPILDMQYFREINPNIGNNKEMFMPDGLHPNNAGYRIIANKIEEFIKNL